MVSLVCIFCVSSILFGFATAIPSFRYNEGYPTGYLADCPGSDKPSIITKESLNSLSITVIGLKGKPSRRKMYTYYQIKAFANDPTMDYSKKTMLYVGGYGDNPISPLAIVFHNEYLKLGYNIWLLDTSKFTIREYPRAARLMRTVGKHVGEILHNLTLYNVEFDPKNLEMVSVSLGVHTMSFIAKSFKALSGTTVGRLTGLDPSGPCFRNLGPEGQLDKSDADFVDVLITNMDGLGTANPMGHVNYYVNGGEFQSAELPWYLCDYLCSHMRMFTLWYAALLHPDSFIAMQCDSVQQARERNCYDRRPMVTNVLGLKANKTKHGIFYLATNYYFPYYMGKKGLKRKYEPLDVRLRELNSADVMIV
ncbi:lipase member H-A-like [Aphomia sociella]